MKKKYSIEIVTNQAYELKSLSTDLFEEVHIAYLPSTKQLEIVEACMIANDLGFRPVPHCPARTIGTKKSLEKYLQKITNEGINKLLCIGGSSNNHSGLIRDDLKNLKSYKETMDIFTSGILEEYGIEEINIAGFPEGNIDDPESDLNVLKKCDWLNQKNIKCSIITQWTTNTKQTNQWIINTKNMISKINPNNFQIHLGIVGPVNLKRLIRFAEICGIQSELLKKQLESNKKNYEPTEYLESLIPKTILHDVIPFDNLHFFPFGGIERLSSWLSKKPSLV